MDVALRRKLEQCEYLPSLPAAAARIVDLADAPSTSMADIGDAVSLDPALAAKLLRTANSPLYGQRRHSDNIREAIVLLGLQTTMTLALSFSLYKSLRAESAGGLNYDLFWRRSILTASIARILGRDHSSAPAEECFLAALLQDIGVLALDKAVDGGYETMAADEQHPHKRLITFEKQAFNADHAEAGAWLLETWHLPSQLVEAVGSSHDDSVDNKGYLDGALRQTVNVAALCADIFLPDADQETSSQGLARAQDYWSVGDDWLDTLAAQLQALIPDIEALFEVKLLGGDEPDRLLQKAKDSLVERSLSTIRELGDERATTERIRRQVSDMRERTKRDILTSLYNRAYATELLDDEFKLSREHNWPLSVIFIDLDRFKDINDNHGHEAGDAVLQHGAQLLADGVREKDIVARWGGEEFLVILPGSDSKTANILGSRLVQAFREDGRIRHKGSNLHVTISAGVATLDQKSAFLEAPDLIQAADRAMYQAKSKGRDRLIAYG